MKTFRSKVSDQFKGPVTLGEMLRKISTLEISSLEDAAQKGAVWLQKAKGKILRERSLLTKLSPTDIVTLYFDPRVLSLATVAEVAPIFENEKYGIWPKKAAIMAQGTQAGDHASLMRFIEVQKKKEIYLIHRLDRETEGLMIFGYTSDAAAKLGELFQKNLILKEYQAVVFGNLVKGTKQTIDVSLDDKTALTHFEVLDSTHNRSLLKVQIETGRLHQIRRHLDHIGHPVMGDPKYGKGNKNREGLKLLAKSLSFQDPWSKHACVWVYPTSLTV